MGIPYGLDEGPALTNAGQVRQQVMDVGIAGQLEEGLHAGLRLRFPTDDQNHLVLLHQ